MDLKPPHLVDALVEKIIGHDNSIPFDWSFEIKWVGDRKATWQTVATLIGEPGHVVDHVMDYLEHNFDGEKILCYEVIRGEYSYTVEDAAQMHEDMKTGRTALMPAKRYSGWHEHEQILEHIIRDGEDYVHIQWKSERGQQPVRTMEPLAVLSVRSEFRHDFRKFLTNTYHGTKRLGLNRDANGKYTGLGYVVRDVQQ